MSDFQYQYRWADLATKGLEGIIDELEARDQALEQFIRDFPCGGSTPFSLRFLSISGDPIATYAQIERTLEEDTMLEFASVFTHVGSTDGAYEIRRNGTLIYTKSPAVPGTDGVFESFLAGDALLVSLTVFSGAPVTSGVDLQFTGTTNASQTWVI